MDYNLIENGTYLYRLKMVDKAGLFTYSVIKKIMVNNENAELSIYPNPITKGGKLQLQLPDANGSINYSIIQTDGKLIKQGNVQFYGGLANISLNSNLAAGNYILQCLKDGKIVSLKFIVQ